MTGPVTRSQILAAVPDWEPNLAAYQPNAEAIEALKKASDGRAIDKRPTFVVFLNGKEIGRIVETPAHSVEEDLAALLRR